MILPGGDLLAVAEAARKLQAGELIGLPTETVYGLGADASNDAAVAKIFLVKGRPADHPLIVHIASSQQVDDYAAAVPEFASRLMAAFWPGPLTLILPRKPGVADAAAGGQDSIGLRCPSHPVAQALLKACKVGVAAPSANRFGRVSPTTAQHVADELGPDLLVLDGGPCDVGIESTIMDCTRGKPVLLRPGVLTRKQLEAACGEAVLDKDAAISKAAPRASGTLESHYAPSARVRLLDAAALQAMLETGVTSGTTAVYARSELHVPEGVAVHRMPADAAAAAHELFAVLRALDRPGLAQILVEAVPASAEWDGVRDRLARAAA